MGVPFAPLEQFVVKVHSRCDLACDHCYVYESIDQSFHGRPKVISDAVVSMAAQRIAEYASKYNLECVQVVLHGGEPLLIGPDRLRRIITEFNATLRGICRLDLRVHTNGVRLTEEFCELFAEYGVAVGVSIDGDRAANDRHRRYRNGRSSYDQVIRAITLLRTDRYRDLYAGLLCTIDIANDPIAVYDALLELQPPRIDFLLPHATWDTPPARDQASEAQYADWLMAIFDRWQATGYPVRIRTFDSIVSTLYGGASLTEALGTDPTSLVVIETDGTYEQADSLKVAFDGAPRTGLNVVNHSLDRLGQHAGIVARQRGLDGLCQECRECPVVNSCGGGLYAHRYRSGSGFQNPSVYCPDLLKLITHISSRVSPVAGARNAVAGHVLSDTEFTQLAAGRGGTDAITQLAGAQRSLSRALVAAVFESGRSAPDVGVAARERLDAAWKVLTSIDRRQPEVASTVLGHPYLRSWAVQCLKRLAQRTPELDNHLDYLSAVAASAAIRGGADAVLTVPVLAGAVHLPGLGRLIIAAESSHRAEWAALVVNDRAVSIEVGEARWTLDRAVLLEVDDCHFEAQGPADLLDAAHDSSAEWQRVRILEAPGVRVALEDTDPYRDCHHWRAAPRLSDSEFKIWQAHFTLAWHEIQTSHSRYAPAIAAGLQMLTPVSPGTRSPAADATSRRAFGAIGTSIQDDPVILAMKIIREFQRETLDAILDLYDLREPTGSRLPQTTPQEDSGSLDTRLQDAYAHLAVTEFWRVRATGTVPVGDGAGTGDILAVVAGQRFAQWQARTRDEIETLAHSGSLTPLGMSFVDEMRHAMRH
jgi:uncharacterized protein